MAKPTWLDTYFGAQENILAELEYLESLTTSRTLREIGATPRILECTKIIRESLDQMGLAIHQDIQDGIQTQSNNIGLILKAVLEKREGDAK